LVPLVPRQLMQLTAATEGRWEILQIGRSNNLTKTDLFKSLSEALQLRLRQIKTHSNSNSNLLQSQSRNNSSKEQKQVKGKNQSHRHETGPRKTSVP
jgi:hypothetical protein